MKPLPVGIVGFSRNQFDKTEARRILNTAFKKLADKFPPEEIEIVSGLTNSGVPKIAYELADQYGFKTTGYSAKQAYRVRSGVYRVNKTIIKGELFGDESEDFINYISGLIRVGGGPQSREEVRLFKLKYPAGELPRRLKEYEVEWFGKPPMKQLFETETEIKPNPETVQLVPGDNIVIHRNVSILKLMRAEFEQLWNSHPTEYHEVMMHGKLVKTPRWQQAYGHNYTYSGSKNNALPISEQLQPFLEWSQENIDPRLNGLLLNWYDGELDHYIGAHRDSTTGLLPDSPIVTISLGEERVFRFRPYQEKGFQDFTVQDGDVVVVPATTNQRWTHEVPKFKRYQQRRISVTLRAYE